MGLMMMAVFTDNGIDDQQVNIASHKLILSSVQTRRMTISYSEQERLTRTYIYAFLPVSYLKKNQREFLKLLVDSCDGCESTIWTSSSTQSLAVWTLSATYLIGAMDSNRGQIDQTLFIKVKKVHILLVQIYVDDIIFGYTKERAGALSFEFEKLMKDKFQMSSMGELTFFLGLQVQQRKKGIFISQDKYVHEILRKFNYTDVKSASTPTDLEKPLVKDADADDVDEHLYRSMIGSLMYLRHSRHVHLCLQFVLCKVSSFPNYCPSLAVK
ncbi:uncharacterized mitochondrial protein-like protein [Tanacetum coccineum]